MLYLVGLGLCDPSDITVKGLEVVKRASRVYLEAYTSILIASSKEDLVTLQSSTKNIFILIFIRNVTMEETCFWLIEKW